MFGITRHFLRGWRTRIFAALVFVLGILETVDPYLLSGILGYKYQGLVILAIGLLTYALREITSTPAGSEGNTDAWFTASDDGSDEGDTSTSM